MNMTESALRKLVHVAVGVIHGADGSILVARRAASQHLGGLWEFPGGKVEPGETVEAALTRELQEELGICVSAQSPLCKITHDYGDKSVLLDVWNVDRFEGQPHGREGQPLRWLMPEQLDFAEFPQANKAIIRAIQLPAYLALSAADTDQQTLLAVASKLPANSLIRLRHPPVPLSLQAEQQQVSMLNNSGHGVVLDLRHALDERWQSLPGIRGVHVNRHVLQQLTTRPVPEQLLFGASCHDADEIEAAKACGADYVLLSPVLPTPSHPDQGGMGWAAFEQLARAADMAVYAMGGLQQSDLHKARACGARGIAGIRLFD